MTEKEGGARIFPRAEVAQLVEHVTENHGVRGSIPRLGTSFDLVRKEAV